MIASIQIFKKQVLLVTTIFKLFRTIIFELTEGSDQALNLEKKTFLEILNTDW